MTYSKLWLFVAALPLLSGGLATAQVVPGTVPDAPMDRATPLGPDGRPLPMTGFGDSKPERIGLHVKDGEFDRTTSELAGTAGRQVTPTGGSGLRLHSDQDRFNALYVEGKGSDFTLSNSEITLSGTGGDDASGIGSAAVVAGGGVLTLKHVRIETRAPVASAAVATGQGTVLKVFNSELITHGGPLPTGYVSHIGPGMMEAPAPLGIRGTARGVNTTVGASSYYYDTRIVSDGWGALSSDVGGKYVECNRCDLQTIDSGYGTYTDSGVELAVNDSRIASATFVSIIAGQNKTTLTRVTAKAASHGIMIHDVMGRPTDVATLVISGGEYTTGRSSLWVKSANADITVDGARFTPGDGIILESVVNDDANATRPTEASPGIHATFRNTQLTGAIVAGDDRRPMVVRLEASSLTGDVQRAFLNLGAGAHWRATRNSELAGLTGSLTQIDAPKGVTIKAHADAVTFAAGTYPLASGGNLSVTN